MYQVSQIPIRDFYYLRYSRQTLICEKKNFFPVSVHRPVKFEGTAFATSHFEQCPARNAFFEPIGGGTWLSGQQGVFPQRIWFQWADGVQIVPAKVGFSNRMACGSPGNGHYGNCFGQSAKSFNIIGSQDCINWETLRKVNWAKFAKPNLFRSWPIWWRNQAAFQCVGIEFESSKSGEYVTARNIHIWENA